MKALLIWAYCLGCNSGTLSVTKFDTMSECDAARTAIMEHAQEGGGWGPRKAFTNTEPPQCIPYVVPEIEP